MRELRFTVRGQALRRATGCDFEGIVPGSAGYLRAKFDFYADWKGCAKAASFFDAAG